MKYMLMMGARRRASISMANGRRRTSRPTSGSWSVSTNRSTNPGSSVSAEGLDFPGQAKVVRAGNDGKPITNGVFPEAKEFLAGYWIVDVESPERAYEIAARASAAPGPGGAPLNMPIEVRQVMAGPPEDLL